MTTHQNTVAHSLVTHQPIPPSDLKREGFFKHYQALDFHQLSRGNYHYADNTDYFMHHEGITFQDHVARQLMTGNELLYYPQLAKKLREIKDYPILKRSYAVDKTLKGLEFLKYFYLYSEEQFNNFHLELEQLSNQVHQFIEAHGQERHLPLIDSLDLVKLPGCNGKYYLESQALIVHGVKWPVNQKPRNKPNHCERETEYLDLHRLLNISPELEYLYLEDFVANTPFIQIRLAKTWQHKGHTKWYNLDTCQLVSKAEVDHWKKPV